MALFHTTVVDNQIKALDTIGTASGAIATFDTDKAERLVNLEVAITATGGGGTPVSPIAINGWSNANIVNMSDITNKAYFDGLLNGKYGFIDLGSLSWNKNDNWGGAPMFATTAPINNAKGASSTSSKANAICDIYETQSRDYIYLNTNVDAFNLTDIGYLQIRTTVSYATAVDFQTAMNGVYLIYELLTPATPTITKAQFETLLSAFSINGSIETIPFGQTVYGGRLNVGSGVLTVTHQAYTYVGDVGESWGKSGDYYYSPINASYRTPFTVIADRYKGVAPTAYTNLNNFECAMSAEFNYINIHDDSGYATVADFRTWLSNNNLTVVYKYVTPIEIQLDSKQIQAIIGTNNVYADTGDIIDLKFILSVGQAIS